MVKDGLYTKELYLEIKMKGFAYPLNNDTALTAAVKGGKLLPFNAHNGDFQIDLAGIPLGTKVAIHGLLEAFQLSNR